MVRTVAQEHFERLQESLAAWKQNNEEMRGESTLLHRTVHAAFHLSYLAVACHCLLDWKHLNLHHKNVLICVTSKATIV